MPPFRILSIDGGGLRGIIPITILEYLLKSTGQKSISDSFDLIAGTSTGGIIACALSLKRDGVNLFDLNAIKQIYSTHGKDIFPPSYYPPPFQLYPSPFRRWRNYIWPKYNIKGLETILKQYFEDSTLQDCKTPILVSAYDVSNYTPFYYTSRSSYAGLTQFDIVKICRSTSAAPTYFPSHSFTYFNNQIHTSCHHIDGGVFVNNPSLAALIEVLKYSDQVIYMQNRTEKISFDDVHILSLGTGQNAKTITSQQGKNWGKIKWAPRLFDIMMQGNSQTVHEQMQFLLAEKKYLRLDISLPEELIHMDDSSANTRQKLIDLVYKYVINDDKERERLFDFIRDAELTRKC